MRRSLVAAAAILAVGGGLCLAGDKAALGKPAPDFELKDVLGRTYKLSEFKGSVVVLEWINQDCPVWRGKLKFLNETYGAVVAGKAKPEAPVTEGATAKVVWLCIDSTNYMTPGRNHAYAAVNGIAKPILMDAAGTVGRTYDARTTPHCFVIDPQGTVVYDGAPDNSQSARSGSAPVNYIALAVESALAGKPVATARTNPYGCSVKYKS
jgi:peroxiredoxin